MPAIQQRSSRASFLPSSILAAPCTGSDPTTTSRSLLLQFSSKLLRNLCRSKSELFLNLVTVIDTSERSSLGPQLSKTISKILLLDLINRGLASVTRPCRPVLSIPSFKFTGPHTTVSCSCAEASIPFLRCSAWEEAKVLGLDLKELAYGGLRR